MTTMTVDSNRLRLGIPFSKIDSERRVVTGIATLDNIDAHGDVITSEASKRAFENFRGNIREMHGPNAVGKLVSFRETQVPGDDGKLYNAIEVDVYISKAEPDVWTKIQEKVYGGFSIGGSVLERAHHDDEAHKGKGFKITAYDLFELSIVDNPANPLANVLAIQKSADGGVSGMVADTNILSILRKGDVVLLANTDEREGFEYEGWVEDTPEALNDVLKKYEDVRYSEVENKLNKLLEIHAGKGAEGGVNVSNENNEEVVVEEEEIAKAADVSEVEVTAEEVVEPANDVFKAALDSLSSQISELNDSVSKAVDSAVEEAGKSFEGQVDSVKTELSEKITELTEALKNLGGRVESLEESTAVKKSANVRPDEVDEEDDEETDNFWRGGFLGLGLTK